MNQTQIQELQDGSIKAFEAMVREFQPLVFRFVFRLLCNEEDAKDIVQETFIKVWLNLKRYKPQYQFVTWLYKIAGNLCYDNLRSKKQGLEDVSLTTFDLTVSSPENMEQSIINRELKEWILFFTGQLTPHQKLVFTLSDIEEMETKEIETITGLSASKIKSNLYLARKFIRDKINQLI
ncbi:MAG: sigma-70 family RNA polymerase sigma factor [Tannerella sp.]|jgi:RNA polymerase sigma-70 factor (ECF subfamily)|nr:sigma-70 family RNA polymerase sigma factor [Tannerella sp.]